MSLALLWIALAAVAGTRSQDLSDTLCCDVQAKCRNVTTMNISLYDWVNSSPHYEPILSTDEYSVLYQGVCVTYFPMSENSWLEFRAINTLTNGLTVSQLFVTELSPGTFRVQGLYAGGGNASTTVHNAYVVDVTCQSCNPLYIYYKCYLFDTCDYVDSAIDVVNGKTASSDIPASCLDAFQSRAESLGFNVRGFVRPPGNLSCVAKYIDSECINYDRIAPENMVTFPLQSS